MEHTFEYGLSPLVFLVYLVHPEEIALPKRILGQFLRHCVSEDFRQ